MWISSVTAWSTFNRTSLFELFIREPILFIITFIRLPNNKLYTLFHLPSSVDKIELVKYSLSLKSLDPIHTGSFIMHLRMLNTCVECLGQFLTQYWCIRKGSV